MFSSVGALEEEEDDDEDDAEECDGKKKLEVKSQASHTKYLMMRGHRSPGIGGGIFFITVERMFSSPGATVY